jgi:hypothetical protein
MEQWTLIARHKAKLTSRSSKQRTTSTTANRSKTKKNSLYFYYLCRTRAVPESCPRDKQRVSVAGHDFGMHAYIHTYTPACYFKTNQQLLLEAMKYLSAKVANKYYATMKAEVSSNHNPPWSMTKPRGQACTRPSSKPTSFKFYKSTPSSNQSIM